MIFFISCLSQRHTLNVGLIFLDSFANGNNSYLIDYFRRIFNFDFRIFSSIGVFCFAFEIIFIPSRSSFHLHEHLSRPRILAPVFG